VAAPAFQAAGAVVRDAAALTVAWPPSHQADDIGLLFVETANQAPTLSTPAGFVQAAQIGTGTAGTSGATMLTIFWCRATGSSQASPVIADSGDHQVAVIHTYRGCIATGNPWDVIGTSVQASAQTGFSIPGATTTVADTLCVLALSNNGLTTQNEVTVPPVNANLTNIVERTDSQPEASTVNTVLRVGPYTGLSNFVGVGPGGDTGAPFYSILGINPHFMSATERQAAVDFADANDCILFITTTQSTPTYGANSATGFDSTAYDSQVQLIVDTMPEIASALTRQRGVAVFCDEPYHSKWLNSSGVATFTPTIVNQKARLHKTKFGSTCITVARADLDKLVDGNGGSWNNLGLPAGGYDALDYGVMQFEGPQGQAHIDFTTALANARTDGNTINVGVIPSINLWAGGNHVTIGGVNQCWDYLNNGTSSGVVAGAVQGSPSPYSKGQQIPCATWNATAASGQKTLVCSPAWIRHIADTIYNDANIPWLIFWIYATSGISDFSWMNIYQPRADFVAALDYLIQKCQSRPSFNGFRAVKP